MIMTLERAMQLRKKTLSPKQKPGPKKNWKKKPIKQINYQLVKLAATGTRKEDRIKELARIIDSKLVFRHSTKFPF